LNVDQFTSSLRLGSLVPVRDHRAGWAIKPFNVLISRSRQWPGVSAPSLSTSRFMPPPTSTTGLLLDPVYRLHETGLMHPETPARILAVIDALEKSGLLAKAQPLTQRPAEPDDILLCHTRDYWKVVEGIAAGRKN